MEKRALEGGCLKSRGRISIPQAEALFVFAPRPQKLAIATAHQRKAALHEADGSITQIVRFPGVIRDTPFAKQRVGDRPVSAAGRASIDRYARLLARLPERLAPNLAIPAIESPEIQIR
jgi:hypothetical protein